MNTSRCDQVLQFALLEAGRQDDYVDRDLGPIHLLKYVYLADLAHAERNNGESFTGATWRFYHYGPWAAEVHERIEPALDAIHAERHTIPSTRYEDDFTRWRLTDDLLHAELERSLPLPVVTAIRRAVRQYGKDTGELLNHVYMTRPMRRAGPGSELILFVAEPAETPESWSAPVTPLTAKQQKKRKERLKEAKDDIKAKLAARRTAREQRKPVVQPPRYDQVFAQGLAWLDHLAGSPDGEVSGEAQFDDEVWHSDTRGEDRE